MLATQLPVAFLSPLSTPVVLAASPLMSPVLILLLCVFSGVATVFILPGHREMTLRKVGGVLLVALGLIFAASVPSWLPTGHAEAVYFWIFSAIAIGGAVRVVTHARPVYSALYFVLTVFASAGLFVLLEAEFMAAALVLIYAGAILVTYVFVIMLASQATGDGTHLQKMAEYDSHSREPAAAAAVGFALMGVLLFVIFDKAGDLTGSAGPVGMVAAKGAPAPAVIKVTGGTQELGLFLFHHQSAQMDVAGIILLVSMVGAIIIARRKVHLTHAAMAAVEKAEMVAGPATPVDDNPHSIGVYGSESRRVKVPV
jgi:NADH-quinone oxidoreductase subunit J